MPDGIDEVKAALDGAVKEVKSVIDERVKGLAPAADLDAVKEEIGEKMAALQADIERIKVGKDRREDDPKKGFKSHADFLMDVMKAADGKPSERLNFCKAVGSDEHSTFNNANAGFLVPVGLFGETLGTNPFEIQADTGIMARQIPMAQRTVHINARVDKNHSTSVTGGLRVYRRAEADEAAASQKNYEQIKMEAEPLSGLAFATEELLASSPISFAALLSGGFSDEYRSALNNERIRGTGVGQYLGVLNSPALITVNAEGGQSADTINITNIRKMRARIYGWQNSVWMVNQDCYHQIAALGETTAGTNAAVFQQSISMGEPDRLLGQPIIYDENMSTLGDVGDIMLINWSEYLEGTWGGQTFDESIHVRFAAHERAFRFNVYNAGQPWWRTALTPKNSESTLSPFVALAAR